MCVASINPKPSFMQMKSQKYYFRNSNFYFF